MAEIKCPKCGEIIKLDKSAYDALLSNVEQEEIDNRVKVQEKLIEEKYKAQYAQLATEEKSKKEASITELKNEIALLKQQIESNKNAQELVISQAVSEAVNKQKEITDAKLEEISNLKIKLKDAENEIENQKKENQHSVEKAIQEQAGEIQQLKNDIQLKDKEFALEKNNLEKQYKNDLRLKQEEVDYYKDLKAKTSVKLLGETLEQHCLAAFNMVRMNSYPHATFVKDNEVVEGTKGDFVFRDWTDEGAELISIMFEMKNESDISATKHKNEDFYKKLDEDRKKKNCEYAVLVSMLEPDNEYFNTGIVDVSYEYPKMFVIRPQFFIPLIGLLYNAAKTNVNDKNELLRIKNQNIDIRNFEDKLYEFQDKFSKNYLSAKTNFEKAIDEIDKTITHLTKVKESLLTADNQLRLANDKAQDLSIRKLTYNNPTMKAKFEELKASKEEDKEE